MELSDLARNGDTDDPRLDHPIYDAMDNVTRVGAMFAAACLMACAQAGYGYSDVLKARRIIDFGTGGGASAFVLGLLAERNGGSVDSLELCSNLHWSQKIKQLNIEEHLPVQVHGVDGLEWMKSKAQQGKRYDLITGCWFAPDDVGERTRGLLSASRQALASRGLLVVYSDLRTMKAVQTACKEESVIPHTIGMPPDSIASGQAETIVIRQP